MPDHRSAKPTSVMNQPQGAECFNEKQFARIKCREILIARQHDGQLAYLVCPIAGKQHPKIQGCTQDYMNGKRSEITESDLAS